MNTKTKDELVSLAITFVATFLLVVGGNLMTSGVADFGWTTVAALLMAGFRSAVKAVILKVTNL